MAHTHRKERITDDHPERGAQPRRSGKGTFVARPRPIISDLRAWTARKDATQLKTDRKEIEALLHTS